ncbi:MAG: Uncharacterized protein FD130_1294, partial [Halothiobacillaceae bacterium]
SGFNLYGGHLITRYDNGAGSLTNANMSSAKGAYVDSDILYAVSGADLSVSGAMTTLYVPNGQSFIPGGHVTTPQLDVTAGSTYNAGSFIHTLTASGMPFIVNGTFMAGSSTVRYIGSGAATQITTLTYYNLQLSPSSATTYSLTGSLSSSNALGGSFTLDNNATLDTTASNYALTAVNITLNGGSTYLAGASTLTASGNFNNSGTFTAGTSTVLLNGAANQTLTTGGAAFYNLTFNNSGASGSDNLIVSGALDINGALTITDGDLDIATNNPTVNTAGNVTISFNGTVDVTSRTAIWTFDGATTFNNVSFGGVMQSIQDVVVSGTLAIPGLGIQVKSMNVTAPGTLNLGNGAYKLVIYGTGTPFVMNGTLLLPRVSIVEYTGTGSATNIANVPYNILWLTPSAPTTYSLLGHQTGGSALTGSLTIGSNATLDATGSNFNLTTTGIANNGTYLAQASTITNSGGWSNSGTFTAGTSTVVLNGTNQTLTGSTTFYNLTKTESTNNATDSILTFDNTATQTINGTLTLDGLDGDDRINLVSNSPGNQWSLVLGASATKAIDFVDVRD